MDSYLYLADVKTHGERLVKEVPLPEDFLSRVNRYKNEEVRFRSHCAYALLFLGLKEHNLKEEKIVLTGNNKPDFTSFHFNVSHSGDLATALLSPLPCGVDIQLVEEAKDYEIVAKRVLSPELFAQYSTAIDKASFFAKAWAILEARQKEIGTGIATKDLRLESMDHPVIHPTDSLGRPYFLSYSPTTKVVFKTL